MSNTAARLHAATNQIVADAWRYACEHATGCDRFALYEAHMSKLKNELMLAEALRRGALENLDKPSPEYIERETAFIKKVIANIEQGK
jgi:hypothetical protein